MAATSYICLSLHIENISTIASYVSVGNRKLSATLKDRKGPNSHYDEVEMVPESLPKSQSKSTAEYDVCGGGVTSTDLAMQENPAYQSVDVTATKL